VNAGATDTNLSPIVPNGKSAVVLVFGGALLFEATGSYVALQWGDASGGWQTVRVIAKEGEYHLNREFIGDGVKRFRIVRRNTDTSARPIIAWIEGLIHDA